jgi:hypothetical protein
MRIGSNRRAMLVAGLALVAWPLGAHATVRVAFDDPARFRDVDRAGGILNARETLQGIAAYLKQLGRRLPPGQDLDVQILDVNLAGVSSEGFSPNPTTRVLSDSTWPSLRLRYRLTQNGRVIRAAEELVADREYLARPNVNFDSDPLRFEKTMLYDWFNARFVLGWAPRT